jgi:hypothetical protein
VSPFDISEDALLKRIERLQHALEYIAGGVVDPVRSASGRLTREQMQDIAKRALRRAERKEQV